MEILPENVVNNYLFYAKPFKEKRNSRKKIQKKFINQIICGDSEEVLKKIPSCSVDLIFTSPPYNFGMEQADLGQKSTWENYFKKVEKNF